MIHKDLIILEHDYNLDSQIISSCLIIELIKMEKDEITRAAVVVDGAWPFIRHCLLALTPTPQAESLITNSVIITAFYD